MYLNGLFNVCNWVKSDSTILFIHIFESLSVYSESPMMLSTAVPTNFLIAGESNINSSSSDIISIVTTERVLPCVDCR